MVYDLKNNSLVKNKFDTVEEMLNSTALHSDMVACTQGYYAKNDGGAAMYAVRAAGDNDTPNGFSTFVAHDLFIELIDDGREINVLQYGMKADGATDNLPVFDVIKTLYPTRTIYFPVGVYAFAGKIVVDFCHIVLDNAELLCTSDAIVDRFVEVRGKITPPETPQDGMFIRGPGGTINGNFKAKVIFACARQKGMTLTGLHIKNFTENGIRGYFDDGTLGDNMSYELYVSNCLISNVLSQANAVGIMDWSDSTYTDIVILNCKTAISASGSSVFHNIHAWCYDFDNSSNRLELMTDTRFALCKSGARFSDCYCDTYQKSFEFVSGHTLAYITNFKWFINTGTWPSGLVPIVFSAASSVSGTNYKVVNAYIPNQCGVQFSDQDLSKSISTFVGVVSYAENTPSSKL